MLCISYFIVEMAISILALLNRFFIFIFKEKKLLSIVRESTCVWEM